MKKSMLVALAIVLGTGANVALADGSPELNQPFGDRGSPYAYGARQAAPSMAVSPTPVASDADARARLQADGYRAIDVARGSDGAWRGTAIRNAAKVNVLVAPDGRILTR